MESNGDSDNEQYDEDEYEEALSKIQEEWKKGPKTRSTSVLKSLMDRTRSVRRKWIEQDRPMTSDILERFPCFCSSRQMREFELKYFLQTIYNAINCPIGPP